MSDVWCHTYPPILGLCSGRTVRIFKIHGVPNISNKVPQVIMTNKIDSGGDVYHCHQFLGFK